MFRLTDWGIRKFDGKMCAYGNVWGNPKFAEGYNIHTNYIMKMENKDKGIMITTKSGSLYLLPYNEINTGMIDYTEKCLPEYLIRKCLREHDRWEKRYVEETGRLLKPGELYLEMAGETVHRAVMNTGASVRPVRAINHIGTFQDSVLVTDYREGSVDFRYFPSGTAMPRIKPYHWSDNLECIKLKNTGSSDIEFSNGVNTKICRTGEVTSLYKAEFYSEGLFSPDAFNGKSVFNM